MSMNVKLEGEALKLYLMKRFNRTEAEATQIVREAASAGQEFWCRKEATIAKATGREVSVDTCTLP
jgi:hypothetical protein